MYTCRWIGFFSSSSPCYYKRIKIWDWFCHLFLSHSDWICFNITSSLGLQSFFKQNIIVWIYKVRWSSKHCKGFTEHLEIGKILYENHLKVIGPVTCKHTHEATVGEYNGFAHHRLVQYFLPSFWLTTTIPELVERSLVCVEGRGSCAFQCDVPHQWIA